MAQRAAAARFGDRKRLSSEELGIDVPAAIEDALEKEPERRKPGENAAEDPAWKRLKPPERG